VTPRERVLLVDNESHMLEALERTLTIRGLEISTAECGTQALESVRRRMYDAIVMDVHLPDIDGLEVCRRLRDGGDQTPILILTARDGVQDRVRGLSVGADDYLVRPFALDELAARIRALIRRADLEGRVGVLQFADLVLDPVSVQVWRRGRLVELTVMEFRILKLLMRNPGRVIPREMIIEQTWGTEPSLASNSLTVHVSRLRRKTESDGAGRLLHTVYGVGYVLRES